MLGASGTLGKQISRSLQIQGRGSDVRAISTNWEIANVNEIVKQTTDDINPGDSLLYAAGLIDASLPPELLEVANFSLPLELAFSAQNRGGSFMAFGTVLERIPGISNPYVSSKRLLSEALRSNELPNCRSLQLNTLYGGSFPHRTMFLGQIIQAISRGEQFSMSAGLQLREYQHVSDVASKIAEIIMEGDGVSQLAPGAMLSNSRWVSLLEIATNVFGTLGVLNLLDVDLSNLPTPEIYKPEIELLRRDAIPFASRDPLEGIMEYVTLCLSHSGFDEFSN